MPPKKRRATPKPSAVAPPSSRSPGPSRKRGREQNAEDDTGTHATTNARAEQEEGRVQTLLNASPRPSQTIRGRRRESNPGGRTGEDGEEDLNAAHGSGQSSSSLTPGELNGCSNGEHGGGEARDEGEDDAWHGDIEGTAADEDASRRPHTDAGTDSSSCACHKRACALSDAEVIAEMERRVVDFRELQAGIKELGDKRHEAMNIASIIAASQDPSARSFPVVRIVVGGEAFTVPMVTLLSREPESYFHALFSVLSRKDEALNEGYSTTMKMTRGAGAASPPDEAHPERHPGRSDADHGAAAGATTRQESWGRSLSSLAAEAGHAAHSPAMEKGRRCGEREDVDGATRVKDHKRALAESAFPTEVFTDSTGAIFIDRDPSTFRHVLNYLRGYNRFHMLDEEELSKLRIDAKYFQLRGLEALINEADTSMDLQFQPGPGINTEGTRFRVVYSVATIGDAFIVTGRHSITFQILSNDYVGLGVVSDSFANTDAEFHKTLNCAVYYMSGVFYTNFPNYRKEEGLAKFENGDFVTITVDMDKGYAEVGVRKASKLFHLGGARRLKFAVTLKLGSKVRIVPPEEAAEQRRLAALEASEAPEAEPATTTQETQSPAAPSGATAAPPLPSAPPRPPPFTPSGSAPANPLSHPLHAPDTRGDGALVPPSAIDREGSRRGSGRFPPFPSRASIADTAPRTEEAEEEGEAEEDDDMYDAEDDFAERFIEGEEEEEEVNVQVGTGDDDDVFQG